MHCKTILTSFLPILLPVIHAATIGEVNGANQALASEVASFDGNVKELGDLSTLLEIQGVVNDIETFATNIGEAVTDGQNTAPAKGDDQEESVAQAWTELCSNTGTYMDDLADKVNFLYPQADTVVASLTKFNQSFDDLFTMIESIEPDADYKVRIDDDYLKNLRKLNKLLKLGGHLVLVH